jgi:protein-tyrosine-phosphatase
MNMPRRPTSVLFCCDDNAVRSPMAEGIAKRDYGIGIYIQSAGVRTAPAIDPLAVAVCAEAGVDIARHRLRSFQQMEAWGDQIGSYDLIVALSPAAQRHALEYTRWHDIEVAYWPVLDPTGVGADTRARRTAYRHARDQIARQIRNRFGPSSAG